MMKKIAILFAALLSLYSCGCNREETSEEAVQTAIDSTWVKIDPEDLQMNPVKAFNKDWFALTVPTAKTPNAMTISWGTIGELWNKPVVIVYVSSSRASKRLMDKSKTFTLSSFEDTFRNRDALAYIGSHSYADDPEKIANSGLELEETPSGALTYKQASMVIECRKIYSEDFKKNLMTNEVVKIYENLGVHSFYIGEIISVWKKQAAEQ